MESFELRQRWSSGDGDPDFSRTMADLEIYIGDLNLTKNENIWSQSIQESILVSTYPLSMWILESWWRLLYEPLPRSCTTPSTDWRMAHELGAANHGFVWPKIIFASDNENIQIWASPSDLNCCQSVRYLNGLNSPKSIQISKFENSLLDFVETVVNRMGSFKETSADLPEFLKIIKEERSDQESHIYRKLEAIMGFNPDECLPESMNYAIDLQKRLGDKTLLELAPIYGKTAQGEPLKPIAEFIEAKGVYGSPKLSQIMSSTEDEDSLNVPWQLAVKKARFLRNQLENNINPIKTDKLFDLLGIASSSIDQWNPPYQRASVSVGIPTGSDNQIKFIPRKRHPISKRFELSRYIGDYFYAQNNEWLTNTDLGTARQKYQRAFAAEFLCPIDGLIEYLDNDFSEGAIEDASEHFEVSQQTITSLLANNHFIEFETQNAPPYHIGFAAMTPNF